LSSSVHHTVYFRVSLSQYLPSCKLSKMGFLFFFEDFVVGILFEPQRLVLSDVCLTTARPNKITDAYPQNE